MLSTLCNAHFRFCHARPPAQWLAESGGFNEDRVSVVVGLRHDMMRFGRQMIQDELLRQVNQGGMNPHLANAIWRRADEDVAVGINYLNDTFTTLIYAGVLF
jgi:hypothetical protein